MSDLVPYIPDNADSIRKQWHDNEWHYSVIDIIAVLTDAEKKRRRTTIMC